MTAQDHMRRVHLGALAACAIFLPWSTAYLSIAQMVLVANWIAWGVVAGDLKHRFRKGFTWPPALVAVSFFGLHALGLLWTSDLAWGLALCRILLPVLVFTVVLSSSPGSREGELRTILLLGAWSAVVSVAVSFGLRAPTAADHRDLSMFISHIRLALLLCFAVVIFMRYLGRTWWQRLAHVLATLFAVYALDRLQSVQGIFLLVLITMVFLWRNMAGWPRAARLVARSLMVLVPAMAIAWVAARMPGLRATPVPEQSGLNAFTAGGEAYTFDATNPQRENGEHVWAWIAWGEVERTWPLRSDRSLEGSSDRGDPMRGTLVRYMTSLGLRKDSLGVMALSEADVRAIERGVTNAHAQGSRGMRRRMDAVLLEMGEYAAYGRADGHSLSMRLEYWRAGIAIVKRHWAMGVGTGDTQRAFDEQYARMGTSLAPQWRHRAHNQYLTLAISFGIFGLLWSLYSWWWPARCLGAWRDPRFIAWAIIFAVGCLTDDTIETQAGATFFALYYALLVFSPVRDPASDDGVSSADRT
ncbi:MAG: O-antigen ligase family protein [Flavobacteriales bacterium]|nr:O-antigen ligase family protein [Flavobacteriales bacterium]